MNAFEYIAVLCVLGMHACSEDYIYTLLVLLTSGLFQIFQKFISLKLAVQLRLAIGYSIFNFQLSSTPAAHQSPGTT